MDQPTLARRNEGCYDAFLLDRIETAAQRPPINRLFFNLKKSENMAKTSCPVTRAEFLNDAKPVEVTINGIPMTAEVKEFSTGSLGWYLNGKANVKVGEKSVSVQIGMNLTIVGSKELPKD